MTVTSPPKPTSYSTSADLAIAAGIWLAVLGIWGVASLFANDFSALMADTGPISVLSALFAASSLLSRQYCLNEVVQYLSKRRQLKDLAKQLHDKIPAGHPLATVLDERIESVDKHAAYVRRELGVLSAIPVLLITIMGVVFLAKGYPAVRAAGLALMTYILCYLSRTVQTSVALAEERFAQDAQYTALQLTLERIEKKLEGAGRT